MTRTAIADPAPPALDHHTPAARLTVEYWTVTMAGQDSCGSCDATLTTVTDAIDTVRPLAERLDLTIEVVPRTVSTWAEAVEHSIAASPTIRAGGIDLHPSHQDGSENRIWHWRGRPATSVPVPAVVDLLVQAVAGRSRTVEDYLSNGGPTPYVRRYLHAAPAVEPATTGEVASCGTGGCG